jgi:hypothetical protein
LSRFLETATDVAATGLAQYAGVEPTAVPHTDIEDWVLATPLHKGDMHFPTRVIADTAPVKDLLETIEYELADAWGAEADILAEQAAKAHAQGTIGFWLSGPGERGSVLNRLEFAERLRMHTGALLVVEAPLACRSDVAAGLASGRADLVAFTSPVTTTP